MLALSITSLRDRVGREVSQTSLSSYFSLLETNQLQNQEETVYLCLKQNSEGLTRKEIARLTGLDLSSVCGRVKALLDRHVIVKTTEKFNLKTRKNNEVLCINLYYQ
jgi:DNA-binding MarR family transcriptional regulator